MTQFHRKIAFPHGTAEVEIWIPENAFELTPAERDFIYALADTVTSALSTWEQPVGEVKPWERRS